MKITCYSYSANGRKFLGGIKENQDNFSLFLQDKNVPFADVLENEKFEVFSSFQEAFDYLKEYISFITDSEQIKISQPMNGEL